MQGLIGLVVLAVGFFIVYKFFPGIIPESWKLRSGKDVYNFMFGLQPGEQIVHQSVGISDPNSHLTDEEVKDKNRSLKWKGQQVADSKILYIAITDRDRLVISYYNVVPNSKPISFDKNNLPKIVDTGRVTKRASWLDKKHFEGYPQYSGDTRIIEIDSPAIPDILIHGSTGIFEMSLAVEFIPILMDWVNRKK